MGLVSLSSEYVIESKRLMLFVMVWDAPLLMTARIGAVEDDVEDSSVSETVVL